MHNIKKIAEEIIKEKKKQKKKEIEEKMDDLGYGMMKTHLDQNY